MSKKRPSLWSREPVAIVNLVQAAIVLLVSFGLKLSAEQIGAILTFTTVVAGFVTRQTVTSPANAKALAAAPAAPAGPA
jgi:hypothetical protein